MYLRVDSAARGLVPASAILWDYGAFLLARGPLPEVPAEWIEPLDDPRVWVNGAPVEVAVGRFEPPGEPRAVIRFAGPIAAAWMEALRGAGVQIHALCPPHGALVELPAGLAPGALARLAPVVGLVPYAAPLCARPLPAQGPAAAALAADLLDVVCFRRDHLGPVAAAIEALGGAVLARSAYKLRVRYAGAVEAIQEIAGVKLVNAARLAQVAGWPLASAVGAAGTDGGWPPGLDGAGEIVAVADTGLDLGAAEPCPDLGARVRSLRSWPVNESWGDWVRSPNADDGGADRNTGHGTFVATLVAGDEAASGGRRRGVAPGAQLVVHALEQWVEVAAPRRAELSSGWYMAGRPLDLRELLLASADAGARIHVNSWGDPARGAYTDDAWEVDAFLHDNPEHLVLFAAGNEGADLDGDGCPDPGSLCAPATAKSALSIGATEGPVAGVGHRGTWGQLDPAARRWRNAADRARALSGRPEHIALMSSAGPTADGRVKPELCAPGTNLAAARSRASAATGWAIADPARQYMYLGGTSVANAVAGGVAALLRQAWRAHLGRAPSGPALKALLLAGAAPVMCRDADEPEPVHVAGFGRIDLAATLPNRTDATVGVVEHEGLGTGQRCTLAIELPVGGSLRVALCWYDPPGERLVHDLDLRVLSRDGAVLAGQRADRINPSERLALEVAPGGVSLEITGANVPGGRQPFGLAWIAPPGARARRGATVPVAALRGVGPRTSDRLAEAGVLTLDGLLARDLVGTLRQAGVAAGRARSLAAALTSVRPLALQLRGAGSLGDASRRGDPAALALCTVFDNNWHDRLQIADLREV